MADPTKHVVRSPSVDARSQRITQLLPIVSGLRHSANAEARAVAEPLQATIRDLERLNDIEIRCLMADDRAGPSLRLAFMEILEKV
jgi:hypothetical protein